MKKSAAISLMLLLFFLLPACASSDDDGGGGGGTPDARGADGSGSFPDARPPTADARPIADARPLPDGYSFGDGGPPDFGDGGFGTPCASNDDCPTAECCVPFFNFCVEGERDPALGYCAF